jgi:hypothetical protein
MPHCKNVIFAGKDPLVLGFFRKLADIVMRKSVSSSIQLDEK